MNLNLVQETGRARKHRGRASLGKNHAILVVKGYMFDAGLLCEAAQRSRHTTEMRRSAGRQKSRPPTKRGGGMAESSAIRPE
jgi:hypothetical protein